MKRFVVYLEGGGETAAQKGTYRVGFAKMIAKCGAIDIRVIPCGSRREAHRQFCNADPEPRALLLVDSEDPVAFNQSAMSHLAARDGWDWPSHVTPGQIHVMATTIETWLSCDPEGLSTYFGTGFDGRKLVQRVDIESAAKTDVLHSLLNAATGGRDGGYSKRVDRAARVVSAVSPHAIRKRAHRFAGPFFDAICPQE